MKSIYKILWRAVGFCLVWWLISTAGAGTAITVYIVFCAARVLFRVCLSALYLLGVALLFLLLLSLLIL